MENENTGTAMAVATDEVRQMVRLDWTPESLSLEIEREKGMRAVMQRYMDDAMRPGHHYYSFKEGDRPALTQEGAHNLSSLFKTIIGPPELRETFHDDGHLTVIARVHIFNQAGERIATGDGMCSTRESKYAYRWAWDNEVPKGFDKSTLKSKRGKTRTGQSWEQFQIPNQDLPDLYNTVLKMAVKRAKVAGVRQLPLVSELFAPEDDGDEVETPKTGTGVKVKKADKGVRPTSVPSVPAETAVDVVEMLVKKLTDHGVPLEDLKEQFLPDMEVASFDELTPEQAEELRPALVTLLNAKIKRN